MSWQRTGPFWNFGREFDITPANLSILKTGKAKAAWSHPTEISGWENKLDWLKSEKLDICVIPHMCYHRPIDRKTKGVTEYEEYDRQ